MKMGILVSLFVSLTAAPAFSAQFKVLCSQGVGVGGDFNTWQSTVTRDLGADLSLQLDALSKSSEIVSVSAPSLSTSVSTATNKDYWADISNSLVCVTVQVK